MAVGRPQPLSAAASRTEFERQGLGFVADQQIWQVPMHPGGSAASAPVMSSAPACRRL